MGVGEEGGRGRAIKVFWLSACVGFCFRSQQGRGWGLDRKNGMLAARASPAHDLSSNGQHVFTDGEGERVGTPTEKRSRRVSLNSLWHRGAMF